MSFDPTKGGAHHQRAKPELVTFDEAAEFFRTSRRTIERWVKAGILPVVSLGGRRLFLREDLVRVALDARTTARKERAT
jgi:excisionase family DNA binding protein